MHPCDDGRIPAAKIGSAVEFDALEAARRIDEIAAAFEKRCYDAKRGALFTLASIALDSLCYLVSGIATIAGWLLREIVGEPRPDAVTQAYFEVGAKQWPPVRAKRPSVPAAQTPA